MNPLWNWDRTFTRKLWRLGLPVTLQNLMLALVAAADALMLGRHDQNSMSAVSLATQVQFVQNMILAAALSAGSILGAQYWGKRDLATVRRLFAMMVRVCGLGSIAFAAACILAPSWLMLAFAHDPELVSIGAGYLRIAGWSYLLTGVSQCYLCVMRVTDRATPSAWISSGAVVLNIVFNAVFIFGVPGAGIPAMGARGAALATLLARAVELALCIAVSLRPGFLRLPTAHLLHRGDRELARDFRRCALPILGAGLLWGVGYTGYTAIMGHLGADAAAANAVASVVRDLLCCVCNGLCAAAGIVVGNELGAGNLERGRLYGNRCAILSFLIGFVYTASVLALTPVVTASLRLTPEATRLLSGMMAILSVYMVGRSVNTIVINGVFAAGGDTLFDFYSLIACMWCFALPTAIVGAFVLDWPVLVVYACTCLDEVGKIPWVMHHHRRYKWVRDLTRDTAAYQR